MAASSAASPLFTQPASVHQCQISSVHRKSQLWKRMCSPHRLWKQTCRGHGASRHRRVQEGHWHSQRGKPSCSSDESDSSATATSMWTPLDGYQPSTSTQRRADAARDAQEEADDLLTEGQVFLANCEQTLWSQKSIRCKHLLPPLLFSS